MFYICALVWQSSKHILITHSPTSHLQHLTKTFCDTPLALNTRHLSGVSDRIGQCLLLQTSSLSTCASTIGGLPNGLGILHSGPACANTEGKLKISMCNSFIDTNLIHNFCINYIKLSSSTCFEHHPLIFRRSMMLTVHVCSLWYSHTLQVAVLCTC